MNGRNIVNSYLSRFALRGAGGLTLLVAAVVAAFILGGIFLGGGETPEPAKITGNDHAMDSPSAPSLWTCSMHPQIKLPKQGKCPICHMALNPYALTDMWEWYVGNLEALERIHPVHYERVVAAIVPFSGVGKEEDVHAFFREYVRQKGKAEDAIQMALEKLTIYSRMKR